MKYLIVAPEYTGSCIHDEFVGDINIEDLNLAPALIEEFTEWNEEYKKIIPLEEEERKKMAHEIERLDKKGVELSKTLVSIPGGAKVKYFSEGKMEYISIS